MTTSDDQQPKDFTEADSVEGVSCAPRPGSVMLAQMLGVRADIAPFIAEHMEWRMANPNPMDKRKDKPMVTSCCIQLTPDEVRAEQEWWQRDNEIQDRVWKAIHAHLNSQNATLSHEEGGKEQL